MIFSQQEFDLACSIRVGTGLVMFSDETLLIVAKKNEIVFADYTFNSNWKLFRFRLFFWQNAIVFLMLPDQCFFWSL